MDSRVLGEYGYRGFRLSQKAPPPTGWQRLAGTQEFNDVPYGIDTSNFAVVDLDGTDEIPVSDLIRRFERKFGNVISTVVETPSGGRHYYFKGKTRNQQREGWDVRGAGGYVVGAQTRFRAGMYKLLSELLPIDKLAPFPEELQPQKRKIEIPNRPMEERDSWERIASARRWLAKGEPIIGSRGHDKMFHACCAMFQIFKLTMDQAIGPILEYNARFDPPFDDRQIRHKLEDAQQAAMQ